MAPKFYAIYVPSTLQGNKPAPAELRATVLKDVKVRLSRLFGGYTSYDAKGGWVSDEFGLIEEDVTVIKAFLTGDDHPESVLNCAEYVCSSLRQECVLVETETGIQFVSVPAYA